MLSEKVLYTICPIMYGATLFALTKKCGGLRPIAVGNSDSIQEVAVKQPFIQQGLINKNASKILLKIDFQNEFNSIERGVMLIEKKKSYLCFYVTVLFKSIIPQQGDPCGPLALSLMSSKNDIRIEYLVP